MSLSLFEIRLRDIVHVIYNADSLNMTPGWRKDLDSETEEYWYQAVSDATTPKAKEILSKEDGSPPSIADIATLDVVPEDRFTPGVYFGFSNPSDTSPYKASICYTGSATGVGWGLTKRVAQHLDPEYRRKELLKHPYSPFYNTLTDTSRSVTFYILMNIEWISTSAADLTRTRAICVLAEQIFMIMFGSYTHSAAEKQQKYYAKFCPWSYDEFEYAGSNMASPIRNEISRNTTDNTALTPQEKNKRASARNKDRKNNWSAEELAEVQDKRHDYHRRVANPVRRFKSKAKNRKMAKSEIDRKVKEFQRVEKQAMKDGLPATNPGDILTL